MNSIFFYKEQRSQLWGSILKEKNILKKFFKAIVLTFLELINDISNLITTYQRKKTKEHLCLYFDNHLKEIRSKLKKGKKINVIILLKEYKQISTAYLYDILEKDGRFNVKIYLLASSYLKPKDYGDYSKQALEFFKSNNIKADLAYVHNDKFYKPLSINYRNIDLVIYQTPWFVQYYNPLDIAKYSLTAYIPYCFYMLNIEQNYLKNFHANIWRYFSESNFHVEEYKQQFNATNVVGLGNPKLDNYSLTTYKKNNNNKPTIIYAPHWTISNVALNKTSTFQWTSEFLLEFARNNNEKYSFVFRPHPRLKLELSKLYEQETCNQIFNDWLDIAKLSHETDYYQEFIDSNLMITDSISFLAEYLPSGNPIIRLALENEEVEFNTMGKQIVDSYYIAKNKEALEASLYQLLVEKNDSMKRKRLEALECLNIDSTLVSQKIADYLKEQFGIKD